jgi:hypothetical protein
MSRTLAGFTLAAFALGGCDNRPDQWDAMIYPEAESDGGIVTIRGFKTAELCQSAATEQLDALNAIEAGTFVCGHRCAPRPIGEGLLVCETTINAEDF